MSRAALVCVEIERRIARGEFADGEKLNESALAKEYDISRTPMREALQMLNGLGLVQLVPNRGAFVVRSDMTRLVEMFEVMAELEAWCVERATKRITAAQRLFLRQAALECEEALAARRIDAYYEANHRLHSTIYEASGNKVLAEEAARMERRLRPYRRLQLDVAGRLKQSMEEHDAILAAIDAGEARAAARLMRAHINTLSRSYDTYMAMLDTA